MMPSQRYPFNEEFVSVHGFQIHYVRTGAGSPVLFVHGNPTYSYLWRDIMPVVAISHTAIALDLLGFGKSEKLRGSRYSFSLHASIIQGFIEKLEIEPLSLVLHDWGGPLGMNYVVSHPEQVHRLVLANTYLSPELGLPRPLRLVWQVLQLPWLSELLIQRFNLLAWAAFTFGLRVRRPERKALRRAYQEPFPTPQSRGAIGEFFRMVPLNRKSASYSHFTRISATLPSLEIPTLILKGEKDPVLNMKRANHLRQLLPNSQLQVIRGAGHFLQEDQPQEVAEVIRRFLDN